MESVIKNYGGLPLLIMKLSVHADRIVYETGTYKAVVISGRAGECIIYFFIMKFEDCRD